MGQLGALAESERKRRGDTTVSATVHRIVGGGKSPEELERARKLKEIADAAAAQKVKTAANMARRKELMAMSPEELQAVRAQGRKPNPAVSVTAQKPDVLAAFGKARQGLAQVQALAEKNKKK